MSAFAIIGLILLGLLAAGQIALAAGAPLGRFAWGGQHDVLPRNLRIGSVVAVLIYAVFALFLLSKAGLVSVIGEPLLTMSGAFEGLDDESGARGKAQVTESVTWASGCGDHPGFRLWPVSFPFPAGS